jgi:PIN domain nuclease of toxin-antitoxin system
VRLLLDTHVLCWAAFDRKKLSARMAAAIDDHANEISFSVAAIWELAVKYGSGDPDYDYNPRVLRTHAFRNGYLELAMTGEHALQVGTLPVLHKDPFDRLLIAQAQFEGLLLVTVDRWVRQYPQLQLF